MFAQIVRAFALKARSVSAEGQDRWAGVSPLAFVREFMSYFRAMGYPLLRTADYPRVDAFLRRDGRSLATRTCSTRSASTLPSGEAERFHEFLTELFEAIGRREELAGAAFDRRAAAEALEAVSGRLTTNAKGAPRRLGRPSTFGARRCVGCGRRLGDLGKPSQP